MLMGLGLIPLSWSVSRAVGGLYQASITSAETSHWETWTLPIGFLTWTIIFFILPRPVRTYVLGHELTHALWALMMGARVGRLKVGKEGGHVELSKTNFLITLAPYFFPFYTVIVIAIYYLLTFMTDMEPHRIWWLAAVGFTWSFHITFTISMLTDRQPDIQEHGRIFSYAIIYIANVLVIGLWMVIIGKPELLSFWNELKRESVIAYKYTWHYMLIVWEQIQVWIQTVQSAES